MCIMGGIGNHHYHSCNLHYYKPHHIKNCDIAAQCTHYHTHLVSIHNYQKHINHYCILLGKCYLTNRYKSSLLCIILCHFYHIYTFKYYMVRPPLHFQAFSPNLNINYNPKRNIHNHLNHIRMWVSYKLVRNYFHCKLHRLIMILHNPI